LNHYGKNKYTVHIFKDFFMVISFHVSLAIKFLYIKNTEYINYLTNQIGLTSKRKIAKR